MCRTAPCATSRATTRSAPTCAPIDDGARGASGPRSRATCARNGKVGTRNYIGVLSTVNCSATRLEVHRRALPDARCWRSTRTSTASSRSPTAPAAAWPTAARATPPCSARSGASPGTRTSPAVLMVGLGCEVKQIDFLTRGLRDRAGPALPHHDDAGHGRHAQDDRARARHDRARCCRDANEVAPPAGLGLARSRWRCSAAARTAIPASPPTRRWATAPTCWCSNGGTGDPLRDARRSTAPSTC